MKIRKMERVGGEEKTVKFDAAAKEIHDSLGTFLLLLILHRRLSNAVVMGQKKTWVVSRKRWEG